MSKLEDIAKIYPSEKYREKDWKKKKKKNLHSSVNSKTIPGDLTYI